MTACVRACPHTELPDTWLAGRERMLCMRKETQDAHAMSCVPAWLQVAHTTALPKPCQLESRGSPVFQLLQGGGA